MTATESLSSPATEQRLYVAFEMGWSKVKIASSTQAGQKPRIKEISARDLASLKEELIKAKIRFGLPSSAPVVSCYEAGRDGFWLHRWLATEGISNRVVDPGSLKVNRRRKRPKTDRIDAMILLDHLFDDLAGKKNVWSVVRVPTLEQEERRQLHRELETLLGERTEHVNRIKSVLATLGIKVAKPLASLDGGFAAWLESQRLLETAEQVPGEYRDRLLREYRRWEVVNDQIVELEAEQKRRVAASAEARKEKDDANSNSLNGSKGSKGSKKGDANLEKIQKMMRLKGIGIKSSWLLVYEFFGWRTFRNRRQVGSLAGLTPTPYDSGETSKELGLNKSGSRWIRTLIVEVAWGWLQWQPHSELTLWFKKRFGEGGTRSRKKGIVALARKLLIALWRWLESDEKPKGAVETDWREKVRVRQSRTRTKKTDGVSAA
jgi:transposase